MKRMKMKRAELLAWLDIINYICANIISDADHRCSVNVEQDERYDVSYYDECDKWIKEMSRATRNLGRWIEENVEE